MSRFSAVSEMESVFRSAVDLTGDVWADYTYRDGEARMSLLGGRILSNVQRLLFVCSRNQWRSPTAERLFGRDPRFQVRSRGVSKKARRTICDDDIQWADLILVMEPKHKQRLLASFPGSTRYKEIVVLDIPDDYQFMDPELVEMLTTAIDSILNDKDGP